MRDWEGDDFVWRRCVCGYRAAPVSYDNADVGNRSCPDCGKVLKFRIKDAAGCLVIWDERSGGHEG